MINAFIATVIENVTHNPLFHVKALDTSIKTRLFLLNLCIPTGNQRHVLDSDVIIYDH